MKRVVNFGTIIVLILTFGNAGWTEWYPGIIHAHSTFSDGTRNPEKLVKEAKASGVRFFIVTDHYEDIDREEKITGFISDDFGFENYQFRFLDQSNRDFVVIAGAEIATYWAGGESHLLAIGNIDYRDKELLRLQRRKDKETQQELINFLNFRGILTIAAHPNSVSLVKPIRPWEIANYQFDPANAKKLRGIEFFNDGSEGYPKTFRFYLLQRLSADQVFVISGCDSHSGAEIWEDPDRWTRKTWVWSEKLDKNLLLQAMAQGHTYAANYGASFGYLNYIPGFQVQEVERAKFVFWVKFEPETTGSKTVRIYRDGNLLPESVQILPVYPDGMTDLEKAMFKFDRIDYLWEDKGVEGEHQYVIEVENHLITSPIKLIIKPPSSPIVYPAVIEGKYFFQDPMDPKDYLELEEDGTAIWHRRYYICGVPPEDVRWKFSDNKDAAHLYSRAEAQWEREFLIKDKGVLVRRLDGTAWLKEGFKYSFSREEASGTYKYDLTKLLPQFPRYHKEIAVTFKEGPPMILVLELDGTCTITMEGGIKKIVTGKWKIDGNRIFAELVDPVWGKGETMFRVLDRNTLIQKFDETSYRVWVR